MCHQDHSPVAEQHRGPYPYAHRETEDNSHLHNEARRNVRKRAERFRHVIKSPHDARRERNVFGVVEHVAVVHRRKRQQDERGKTHPPPAHETAKPPSAPKAKQAERGVQQMARFINVDGGIGVEKGRKPVEHTAVKIKVEDFLETAIDEE